MGTTTSKRSTRHNSSNYGDDEDLRAYIPGDVYDKYQVYVPSTRSLAGEVTTMKANQSTDPRGDLDHLVGMPDEHSSLMNPRLLATATFRNKTGLQPTIPLKTMGTW